MDIKNHLRVPRLPLSTSTGLLAVRLVIGFAFMNHGWGKIQTPFSWMGPDSGTPGFFQALAAISEFGGGLAWMLGLLVHPASFGIACTMGVALYTHILVNHDPFIAQGSHYEPAAAYFSVALLLLLGGPGKLSADAVLFGER